MQRVRKLYRGVSKPVFYTGVVIPLLLGCVGLTQLLLHAPASQHTPPVAAPHPSAPPPSRPGPRVGVLGDSRHAAPASQPTPTPPPAAIPAPPFFRAAARPAVRATTASLTLPVTTPGLPTAEPPAPAAPVYTTGELIFSPAEVVIDRYTAATAPLTLTADDNTPVRLPTGSGGQPFTLTPTQPADDGYHPVWNLQLSVPAAPLGSFVATVRSADATGYASYSGSFTVRVIDTSVFTVTPSVTQVSVPAGSPMGLDFHFAADSLAPGSIVAATDNGGALQCLPDPLTNPAVTLPVWHYSCTPGPLTPAGTYPVTFTFSRGSTQHTLTIPVTVTEIIQLPNVLAAQGL